MDTHLKKIASLCRFCAKPAKTKTKCGKRKELFRNEFLSYGVQLEEDVDSVHPHLVCQSCSRHFYLMRSSGPPPESPGLPFAWEPHSEEDENCVCKGWKKDSRGRPPKRKAQRIENESDTESGEEVDYEKEKALCSIFTEMTQNLHLLDEELAKSLCSNICSIFGFVLIDPNDVAVG